MTILEVGWRRAVQVEPRTCQRGSAASCLDMSATSTNPNLDPKINYLPFIIGIGAALVLSYLPVVRGLVTDWMIDENVGHGFFVPIVAVWVAWQSRELLAATELKPNWLGLIVVVGAGCQLYLAILGAEQFLARTAFVFAITGSVLWLGGWRVLKLLAFPIFLLLFMIPIPAIIYNQITLPLQFMASAFAENSLSLMGIPVLREGNILELPSQRLSVVEACSGIRSLLSLSFLALVYGYFFEKRHWVRILLLFSTVPIAIVANAARVTITGLVSEIDPDLARGVFHFAEGWVVFVAALALLVLTHRLVLVATRLIEGTRQAA
jgi:exosortase